MEVSRYIQSLLRVRESVILGGFGAFVSEEVSAQLNPTTKEIIPPHKEIKFDGTMTRDSGVLAQYIAKKEKISKEDAEEKIKQYTEKLKEKLDSNQTVELKGLGRFTKGKKGYEFTFISDDNLLLEAYGLEKVHYKSEIPQSNVRKPLKKKKEKKTSPRKANPKANKTAPSRAGANSPKNKDQYGARKSRWWLGIVIPVLLIGILLTAIYFFKPEYWNLGKAKIAGLLGAKEKYEIIEPTNSGEQKTPEEDGNQTSEEYAELSKDSLTASETATAENLDQASELQVDESLAENSETNETPQQTQEVQQNTSEVSMSEDFSSAQKGQFYIVVASVKYKKSAKSEKQRFESSGIPVSIVFAPDIKRYRISAGVFSSSKAAHDKLRELQEKHNELDGWVWAKK
ncbi:MAG: hypothetical protein CSB06_03640 [Bacteroidia bacterium]|nr:MAG: hypothetical protein CSB06_03640 [Bacteroidia bacterium]